MAKQINDMRVLLQPDRGAEVVDPEAIGIWAVWYEVVDDADDNWRKRGSFLLSGQAGTDTCNTVYAAAVAEVKSREGIA